MDLEKYTYCSHPCNCKQFIPEKEVSDILFVSADKPKEQKKGTEKEQKIHSPAVNDTRLDIESANSLKDKYPEDISDEIPDKDSGFDFILSDKIYEDQDIGKVLFPRYVAEFIRLETELIYKYFNKEITMEEFMRERDKLAGSLK